MTIYVTRHGETDWNVMKKIQGWTDIPLNAKGKEQALSLHEQLKDIPFKAIYASDLKRAFETATIIKGDREDIPLYKEPRLREFCYGDIEGQHVSQEIELFRQEVFFRYPNGENCLDAASRIYPLLDAIRQQYQKDDNILLVSHGGVSKIIFSYFSNMKIEEYLTFGLQNCQVMKFVL